MLPRSSASVLAWWQLAQTDLRVAKVVVAVDPPAWAIVCFLAQQAGEKGLKAVLEALELSIPRTHDLTTLVDLLPDGCATEALVDDAIRLSDYGVKPRYPVPSFVATADQAKAAIAAAERVLDWADARWRVGPGG